MNEILIDQIIENALKEDLGWGDVTTDLTCGKSPRVAAGYLLAKQDGILSGIEIFKKVLQKTAPGVEFEEAMQDGERFTNGAIILRFKGSGAGLLSGERVALNFLQHMSGVATLTKRFVKETEGTKAKIVDTRKTLPGLRILEKYAVRCGGGANHRYHLSDMILIKDNHISYCGSITHAVNRAKEGRSMACRIEVETTSIEEVKEALACGVDVIMLDNMSCEVMKEAVDLIAGRRLVEASGNVGLENVRDIAHCGVDFISVGMLTHSVTAADISMKFSDGI